MTTYSYSFQPVNQLIRTCVFPRKALTSADLPLALNVRQGDDESWKALLMTVRPDDTSWPRVSVVIPTLNEARNLPHVFAGMPEQVHEVIVVDGHSVDDTVAVAKELWPDVRIVMQTRRGKGNALACGFAVATGDIIAMVDADGSADPAEIPNFVKALVDGADFAKGSRFAKGGGAATSPASAAGQPGPHRGRQRDLQDQVHGPLLRLQRVLAACGPGNWLGSNFSLRPRP